MRLVLACGHLFFGAPEFIWLGHAKHSVVLCPLGCGRQTWLDIDTIAPETPGKATDREEAA